MLWVVFGGFFIVSGGRSIGEAASRRVRIGPRMLLEAEMCRKMTGGRETPDPRPASAGFGAQSCLEASIMGFSAIF